MILLPHDKGLLCYVEKSSNILIHIRIQFDKEILNHEKGQLQIHSPHRGMILLPHDKGLLCYAEKSGTFLIHIRIQFDKEILNHEKGQ